MSRIATGLFLALALAMPWRAFAATHAQPIDALIRSYNKLRQFNGSVLVAEKGRVILRKGYGMANMEWRIPNGPDTRFRIGSITKQFTSMLIMQLVSEGKVGLDDKITKYLPAYRKDTGDKVTVRHLLTHTSGIPNYTDRPGWREETVAPHPVADFVKQYAAGDLEFEPGSRFHYSNSGYFLLGAIIEQATGSAYEDVLRDRIFGPLGMKDSGYDHAETVLLHRASGYQAGPDGYRNARYLDMSNPYAAGALFSTVDDLFKWDRALYTDELLDEQHKRTMWTPARNGYAFGWGVSKVRLDDGKTEVSMLSHNGGINGFSSILRRMPDTQDFVVVLDNMSSGNALDALAQGILDILHDIEAPLAKESIVDELAKAMKSSGVAAAVARYRELKAKEPRKWDFSEDALNDLGYQALQRREVDRAIEALRLNVEEYPKSSNVYDSLGDAYEVHGDRELALESYRKSVELNPQNTNGEEAIKRLQQPAGAVDVPRLARYVGTYRLSSGGDLIVMREADKLVVQTPGLARVALVADSATAFHRSDGRASITFAPDGSSLVLHQGGSDVSGKWMK